MKYAVAVFTAVCAVVVSGCVSLEAHRKTVAELEETRKASAETAAAFESFKKKTAVDLEALSQAKAELAKLTAALTEARTQAKGLETKLSVEQVKVATLREEKQRLMSGTTTAQAEIARIQKRIGELETVAARVSDLEKRLDERDREIGKLRQASADRETLAAKVAALTQERDQLTAEVRKQQEALKLQKERTDPKEGDSTSPEREPVAKETETQRLTRVQEDLTKSLQADIANGDVRIHQARNRLTITMADRLLFDPGQGRVKSAGLKVLKQVSSILKTVTDRQIRIEGHTDNAQIGAKLRERFPTNWDLCMARATSVVRHLEKSGVDRANLSVVGYADTRPVAGNDTEKGRAANRRIEIVLYPKDKPEAPAQ